MFQFPVKDDILFHTAFSISSDRHFVMQRAKLSVKYNKLLHLFRMYNAIASPESTSLLLKNLKVYTPYDIQIRANNHMYEGQWEEIDQPTRTLEGGTCCYLLLIHQNWKKKINKMSLTKMLFYKPFPSEQILTGTLVLRWNIKDTEKVREKKLHTFLLIAILFSETTGNENMWLTRWTYIISYF